MTDLRAKRGDTIDLVVGPVRKADGTLQDLTGYTIAFSAKAKLSDATGAAIITQAGTVTNGPAGLGLVTIPPGSTSGFTTDRVLHWDIQITGPTGVKKTIDSGTILIERDVTTT